jgi:aspartyl protease family protein
MLPRIVAFSVAIILVALAAPNVIPPILAYVTPQESSAGASTTSPTGQGTSIAIAASDDGHFRTEAVIDGHTVAIVIDTGATTVALSGKTARALGFHLAPADYTASVATANGTVRAAPVSLDTVRIGDVAVRDVMAVVLEGDGLELNLLGMSFLNRLTKVEAAGGQLVLVQ